MARIREIMNGMAIAAVAFAIGVVYGATQGNARELLLATRVPGLTLEQSTRTEERVRARAFRNPPGAPRLPTRPASPAEATRLFEKNKQLNELRQSLALLEGLRRQHDDAPGAEQQSQAERERQRLTITSHR